MSDAPETIDDLKGVLRALRHATGSLVSQADQIDQMKGMFRDEDDAIANAIEDGEDSMAEIDLAVAYVESLIEAEAHDAAVGQALDAEAAARDLKIAADLQEALDGARMSGIAKPTAAELHELARDIRDELATDQANVEEAEDAEVVLTSTTAEKAIALLIGAAVAADDADRAVVPEVLVNCYGGIVQDVLTVAGQPKVLVYVQDNDLEGKDPGRDNDLVLLQDEDPTVPDFHAEMYTTEGDAFPSEGRRWTTLRAEAARLHAGGIRSDLVEDDEADDADGTDAA